MTSVSQRRLDARLRGHDSVLADMAPTTKGNARETSRSGGDRRRLGRRHARRNAVAHRAGRQAPPLRHQARPARRGEGALPARHRDARLPGHHQERQHLGRVHLDHARVQPLSDRARLPARRQARDAGEADRAGTVGGRRADHARQAQQPEIHHRLFAALQHQDRLRQEEDHRRHARQGGLRAGQPASLAQPRQEDRKPRAALAGGDGIDPRPRFRVLAAGAREARAGLLAGRLRLHGADQRLARRDVHHRDHGQRRAW